jgi:hypothetical protein
MTSLLTKDWLLAGEPVQRRHSTVVNAAKGRVCLLCFMLSLACALGVGVGEGEADIYIPEEFPISPDTSTQFQAPLIGRSDQN